MPSIYDRNGDYTAFGLRAGYKHKETVYSKNYGEYVLIMITFHQLERKYFISTAHKGRKFGADSEFIGTFPNAKLRFKEIKTAVEHAMTHNYLNFNLE